MLSWVSLLFINNLIKEHENQPSTSGFKRGFPSKNSLSFVRVKSTSAFHLPVLYLGLKKNLPQHTKPKIIFVLQGLFACFPYGWIALKNTLINNFPDIDDRCDIFMPQYVYK